MDITRTFARRRWLALTASIAVVLGVVGGTLGGAAEPAAAADPVPTIHGALVGDRWLPSAGGTLIERVSYENLTPGVEYKVLVIMRVLGAGSPDLSELPAFTPTQSAGTIDIPVAVPAGYAGRTLVATAFLFQLPIPDPIAYVDDRTDPLQTAIVIGSPSVHGAISGERWDPASGWIVTDRVSYQNLTPGGNYIMFVIMQNPEKTYTDISERVDFKPTSPSGTMDLDLVVPPSYAGRTLVATVFLFQPPRGDAITTHIDFTDPQQRLVVRGPLAIRSSLTDLADGDRELSVSGGDLIDVVSYENLEPGTEYTITGTLMRRSDAAATPLTSGTTFTPTEPNGTVELPYTVPPGYEGESLVAFDRLYAGTDTSVAPIAQDAEIDDPTQTVTVARADAPIAAIAAPKLAATGLDTSAPLGLAAAALAAGALLLLTRRRRTAAPPQH